MTKENINKPLFWTNVIVFVLFGLLIASVVFGWTNPSSSPPTPPGAIRAVSGEVGIGTDPVGGNALSISGQLNLTGSGQIVNTLWPTASSSAATKGYVDAQAGGSDANAGGITTVTLFGAAATEVLGTSLYRGGNSSVPSGCHNQAGTCFLLLQSLWGSTMLSYSTSIPPPGDGTQACTSLSLPPATSGTWEWFEIFAGYGPHETVVNHYAIAGTFPAPNPGGADPFQGFAWQVNPDGTSGFADTQNNDIPISAVSVSDSVCGQQVEQNVSIVNTVLGNQVGSSAGLNSACTAFACNTCRICGLARTVAP